MRLFYLALSIYLGTLMMPLWAQVEEEAPAVANPPAASAVPEPSLPAHPSIVVNIPQPMPEPPSTAPEADHTIAVDFMNESVRHIIRYIADLYDLNVVIPDTLDGNISIKLRGVTWQQVFQVILEPLGYIYTYEGNIIRIRGKSQVDQEPVTTAVFIVNYADLKDVQQSISALIDEKTGGKVQIDKRSNAIIITERPSRIRDIEKIIKQLDAPTPQVMIESKFVEVTDNDQKNLGINWQSLSGYTLSVSGGLANSDSSSSATGGNTGTPAGVLSSVLSKATGYTINPDGSKTYKGESARVQSAVLSASQFNLVLSALNTFQDAKVLSNPTVVTLNNVEASVTVSTQYPLPQYSYNDQTGTFEVSGFDYKDVGIMMKVLPQINSEGFITLNVKPELSTFNTSTVSFGGTSTGANSVQLPIIDSRRTKSIVTLRDGYTLAIGGLLSSDQGNTVNKVPILGDLPLIGLAFRSVSKSLRKRNLIIFITAKSIDPAGATYKDVFDPRTLHEMRVTPADVPGYKLPDCLHEQMESIEKKRQDIADMQLDQRLQAEKCMLEIQACKTCNGHNGSWNLQARQQQR